MHYACFHRLGTSHVEYKTAHEVVAGSCRVLQGAEATGGRTGGQEVSPGFPASLGDARQTALGVRYLYGLRWEDKNNCLVVA